MQIWDYATIMVTDDRRGNKTGEKEFTSALGMGFEPYAVTHWVEQPQKSALTSIPAGPVMVEKHHLRRIALAPANPPAPEMTPLPTNPNPS